jgi:Kef-type K+ transport system membrane component KefB
LLWLGDAGNNQPGLPIFFLGLALSGFLAKNQYLRKKLRTIAFALVTPFFFFQGGLNVGLKYVWASIGIVGLFIAVKLITKFIGVGPFALLYHKKNATFTTLLMSTGLTFGTISSEYGLAHHIIDLKQFSILLTCVIVSAVLPTILALKGFRPQSEETKDLITLEGAEG